MILISIVGNDFSLFLRTPVDEGINNKYKPKEKEAGEVIYCTYMHKHEFTNSNRKLASGKQKKDPIQDKKHYIKATEC